MIHTHSLRFDYGNGKSVINYVNLNFEEGKIYGLLGLNGQGKTTLIYLLCGLLKPSNGTIGFKGKNVSEHLPETLQDIFLVPEELALPSITLEKFVKYQKVFYPNFSQEVFDNCCQEFGIEKDVNLAKTSMGTKKKAYISFAVACNTPLLILDEPTNGLDIIAKSQFRKIIAGAMTDNRTIILSTHQVRDVENLIDHFVILNNGKVAFDKSTLEITQKLAFHNGQISRVSAENEETNIDIEALFTAVIKGEEVIKEAFEKS